MSNVLCRLHQTVQVMQYAIDSKVLLGCLNVIRKEITVSSGFKTSLLHMLWSYTCASILWRDLLTLEKSCCCWRGEKGKLSCHAMANKSMLWTCHLNFLYIDHFSHLYVLSYFGSLPCVGFLWSVFSFHGIKILLNTYYIQPTVSLRIFFCNMLTSFRSCSWTLICWASWPLCISCKFFV